MNDHEVFRKRMRQPCRFTVSSRCIALEPVLQVPTQLEVLEKVSEKVDRQTVFGGLNGVLQDTVKIDVRGE